MRSYRVRFLESNEAITERLFALGYHKLAGCDEWLLSGESKEQVRSKLGRAIPGQRVEVGEWLGEYALTLSLGKP